MADRNIRPPFSIRKMLERIANVMQKKFSTEERCQTYRLNQRLANSAGQVWQEGLELRSGDISRQRSPTVPVVQQDDNIGAGCHRLTAGDLRPANPHRALVTRRFLGDAPSSAVAVACLAKPDASVRSLPFCEGGSAGQWLGTGNRVSSSSRAAVGTRPFAAHPAPPSDH